MKQYPSSLNRCPLFHGMEIRDIERLLSELNVHISRYRREETLLRCGQPADFIGYVLSGSILVVQDDFWSNRNLIHRFTAGQLFADAFACFPEVPVNVSILADSDCTIAWLDVQRALRCAAPEPAMQLLTRNLVHDLAAKTIQTNEKVLHLCKRTTRDKLLSYLSAEAKRQGSSEFDIPFNRQQLADYLSVERSAMSAELSKLKRDGVLTYDRSHFSLLTP